jgi:hypothetical protein
MNRTYNCEIDPKGHDFMRPDAPVATTRRDLPSAPMRPARMTDSDSYQNLRPFAPPIGAFIHYWRTEMSILNRRNALTAIAASRRRTRSSWPSAGRKPTEDELHVAHFFGP